MSQGKRLDDSLIILEISEFPISNFKKTSQDDRSLTETHLLTQRYAPCDILMYCSRLYRFQSSCMQHDSYYTVQTTYLLRLSTPSHSVMHPGSSWMDAGTFIVSSRLRFSAQT